MMSKYEKLLYAEIATLAVITLVTAVVVDSVNASAFPHGCEDTLFRIVPYIANHHTEVCTNEPLLYVIMFYYLLSTLTIFGFGYLYMRGRSHIYVFDKKTLVFVSVAVAAYVIMWIIGNDGSYRLDFTFHRGFGLMFFVAPLTTACAQFLLTVALLPDRN